VPTRLVLDLRSEIFISSLQIPPTTHLSSYLASCTSHISYFHPSRTHYFIFHSPAFIEPARALRRLCCPHILPFPPHSTSPNQKPGLQSDLIFLDKLSSFPNIFSLKHPTHLVPSIIRYYSPPFTCFKKRSRFAPESESVFDDLSRSPIHGTHPFRDFRHG